MDTRARPKAPLRVFAELTDSELVMRMRGDDERAWTEFFDRFRELLCREARRCGEQPALCDEIAFDSLADSALSLMRHTMTIPRSLPGYLCVALRNAVFNAQRTRRHDEAQRISAVWDSPVDIAHAVIRETASDYSLRATDGGGDAATSIAPALLRLSLALDATLTIEERRLLGWIGEWVPQAHIADWLGVSYGSLRVRLSRLRDRLRMAADAYAIAADATDQEVLRAFFRRASIRDGPGGVARSGDGEATTRDIEREEEAR